MKYGRRWLQGSGGCMASALIVWPGEVGVAGQPLDFKKDYSKMKNGRDQLEVLANQKPAQAAYNNLTRSYA